MSKKQQAVTAARNGLVAQRNAALAAMSKSLRHVFERVENADVEIANAAMEYYFNIGQQLNDVAENPNKYLTPEQIAKGVDAVGLLMQAFGASKDAKTRAMTFARLYDRRDMARLLDTKSKNFPEFKFQWAHIRHLISVDPKNVDSKIRLDFENKTRDNGWTPNELADAVIQYYNGKRRSGGRPLSTPKTLTGQLSQVIEMSELFVRRHKEVWNGEKHSIFVNIMNQPKASLGEDTAIRVISIRNRMQEVRKAAEEQLAMCERTLEYLQHSEEVTGGASTDTRAATAIARAKSRVT